MKTFIVSVRETYVKDLNIKANSEEEAAEITTGMEINMNGNDCLGDSFEIDKIEENGEGYFVQDNGDNYQSVFHSHESELSQLHTTIKDAVDYMVNECNINIKKEEIRFCNSNGEKSELLI